MSKRQLCETCLRPLKTCICKHVRPVSNAASLIILQHPQEVYEAKNSAKLLNLCLKNSQIHVGEVFDDGFFQKTQAENFYDLLLYPDTPEEKSLGILKPPEIDVSQLNSGDNLKIRLWVLDGTWRKSRKMLYLNPAMQSMPRLSLQDCPPSLYTIRKAHSENQLSTLEASCYALQQLEHYSVDYSPVLSAFAAFVAEQHTFLPSSS
ncbi:MAG: DTW domain-containing protein [Gammaproteobacteria bacterium]|nr:MAG: DTW domain-containing protein [Gammaproteobacteria bacterium]